MTGGGLPDRFFVTGTDTDVGKTLACAVFMAGDERRVYWKPVQSGSAEGTDAGWVMRRTGASPERFLPETHLLEAPLSPHAAAALEDREISLEDFSLPETATPLVVEGAGGVMVPINGHHFMIDIMVRLGLPVVLVARSTLGTINHTLLTIEGLRARGLEVAGVVFNGPPNTGNRQAVEHFGGARVILEIPPLGEISPAVLKTLYQEIRLP